MVSTLYQGFGKLPGNKMHRTYTLCWGAALARCSWTRGLLNNADHRAAGQADTQETGDEFTITTNVSRDTDVMDENAYTTSVYQSTWLCLAVLEDH